MIGALRVRDVVGAILVGIAYRAPMRRWIGLTKYRLNLLVLFAVGGGYVTASGREVDPVGAAFAALGAALSAFGASALNMVMEREFDARMDRTRDRPVASGEVSPRAAVVFGVSLLLAGLGILAAKTTWSAAAVSAAVALIYLGLYTPLKRVTTLNTLVGAVPGALPPVLGWAAAGGSLTAPAPWVMFGIIFFWQIPHFLAIATVYRDDYERGGFRMLPAVDPTLGLCARQVVLNTVALILVSMAVVAPAVGLCGSRFLVVALVSGAVFLAFAMRFAWVRDVATAKRLFWASLVYLPVVWAFLVIDRIPRA